MPQYESSESHVIDVETAVKDGILGATRGGAVSAGEKLDLKKMILDLDPLDDVPPVFICPISLEPMLDPVTLCTGQTYEKSNILKWFSFGNLTCPTTMQELWDDTVTPNKTLQHLIYVWFSQKYVFMKKKAEDVNGRAIETIDSLKSLKGKLRVQALKDLRGLVTNHVSTRKSVVSGNGVGLICNLLGRFTSHAVGSEVIGILVNLNLDSETKTNLMEPAKISLVIDLLNEGTIDTKINCTKFLEMLMEERGFRPEVVSSLSLLVGILRLVKDKRHPNGVLAGIRVLRTICSYSQVRALVVSVGAVPQIVELLPDMSSDYLEPALHILVNLSSVPEGELALKNCTQTIPYMVRLLMRVSENCTQSALNILSAVCKLDPSECGRIAVEAGLAAKLLLVIQSGCDQALKQRSAELLKLCSLNYTHNNFISKCKLTRTMQ